MNAVAGQVIVQPCNSDYLGLLSRNHCNIASVCVPGPARRHCWPAGEDWLPLLRRTGGKQAGGLGSW